MSRTRALTTAFLLAVAAGSASCAGGAGGKANPVDGGVSCSPDNPCGNGTSCVSGLCVLPASSIANLAIEIDPVPGSDAAITELFPSNVSVTPLVLKADSSFSLTATFPPAPGTPAGSFPATASAVLALPSLIPGRPDLAFEASHDSAANTDPQMKSLSIPEAARGRSGSISLIPVSPGDQTSPPFAFDVAIPASGNNLPTLQLPATFTISGALVDSLGTGKGSFNARAFMGNVLVSTRTLTMDNTPTATTPGGFILVIPTTFAGKAIAVDALTVQLTPLGTGDPWLTLAPSVDTNLDKIKLPAYLALNAFQVTVHGDDPASGDPEPVSGATVRMYTMLEGSDPRATTRFLRDIIADSTGTATLTLIPGATGNARLYTLSVVPPAGSVWAATCISNVPVPWNGTPDMVPALLLRDVMLARRPVVTGTVVSATGAPVGNVVVTATRGDAPTIPCLPGPSSTSVTTDTRGEFTLPLDPGRYQFDYDPPAGSSAPRTTEFDVDVQGAMVRPFRLPAPALVEGQVVTAAGTPLPNATIRLFETRCPSVANCPYPPILRAQTQSDDNGHFRAIVAGSPN